MAVGSDQRQALAFGDEQDAVQVVADVVHRHREVDLGDQVLQRLLRHAEHRPEIGRLLHQREVVGRHRLQREAALAAGQRQLRLRCRQRHRLIRRHRAQDVDQLSRPDRGREVARIAAKLGAGADLDLEVAGRELDRAAGLANEHVGEDRQRVPTLDDSRDGLQRTQEFFLCCFQDNHFNLLNWS